MKTIKTVLGYSWGLLLGLSLLPESSAMTKSYTIGSDSSVSANQGSGLIIDTVLASGLAGKTFSLNDGQSTKFEFFTISTPEASLNTDDIVPQLITATLDFKDPDVNAVFKGVTFTGVLNLDFSNLLNPKAYIDGEVKWGAPQKISVGDREFSVSLNDASFDKGNTGGTYGDSPATIWAPVTQISSRGSSVPDGGATMLLLGLAFGVLMIVRRVVSA